MFKDPNKREVFIQKRAEGLSYEKISKEIGVSKPTLIKWGKEEKELIKKTAKNIEEEFLTNVRKQAQERELKLKNIMNAAYESLRAIDYNLLSERELLQIILKLEAKLKVYLDAQLGEEPDTLTVNIIE